MQTGTQLTISACCALFIISFPTRVLTQEENIVRHLDVSTPRAFGYTIGDTIERKIVLELEKPYELDENSLPSGGKLGFWLELRPPTLRRLDRPESTEYTIALTYQPFLLAEAPQQAVIPRLELSVGNGDRDLMLVVPDWAFTIMPLMRRDTQGRLPDISPAHKPAELPADPHLYRAIAFSIGLLAALLYLAYLRWGIPFLVRRNRPFAKALRRIRRTERSGHDTPDYEEALRTVHEALNGTAGGVVFAETLDQFFVQHPQFEGIRETLEAFFSESRAVFFHASDTGKPCQEGLRSLIELCRQGRRLEQSLA